MNGELESILNPQAPITLATPIQQMATDFAPLADGQYFSPDIGRFTAKDGTAYTEYGLTFDTRTSIFRLMSYDNPEDYSLWTPEKRQEIREAIETQNRLREEQRQARIAHLDSIAEPIIASLTEEQIDALQHYFDSRP